MASVGVCLLWTDRGELFQFFVLSQLNHRTWDQLSTQQIAIRGTIVLAHSWLESGSIKNKRLSLMNSFSPALLASMSRYLTRPSDSSPLSSGLSCVPVLPPRRGSFYVESGTGVSVGSVLAFWCREGYQLVGSDKIYCTVKKGKPQWSNYLPVCEGQMLFLPSNIYISIISISIFQCILS